MLTGVAMSTLPISIVIDSPKQKWAKSRVRGGPFGLITNFMRPNAPVLYRRLVFVRFE